MNDQPGSCDAVGSYLIKTFGATREHCQFYRLPKVVQRAKEALSHETMVGFLVCALERQGRMTGLLFSDPRQRYPEGLPVHTPPIVRRFNRCGYLVVEAGTGGLFAVVHWYYENGELGPFYALQ